MIAIAVGASYRCTSISHLRKIPAALTISVVLRWLGGICSHSLLLAQGSNAQGLGSLVGTTRRIIFGQSIAVLAFVYVSFVVFNFFMTSKGLSRASEVLARFYLDSVPGRQIAIDADLASGQINYADAKASRSEINDRSSLYGMLDSISKFMVAENLCSILIPLLFGASFFALHLKRGALDVSFNAVLGVGLLWQLSQLFGAWACSYVLINTFGGTANNKTDGWSHSYTKAVVIFVTLAMSFEIGSFWPLVASLISLIPTRKYRGIFRRRRSLASNSTIVGFDGPSLPTNVLIVEVDSLIAAELFPRAHKIAQDIDRVRLLNLEEHGFRFPRVIIVDNMLLGSGKYRIGLNSELLAEGELIVGKLLAIPELRINSPKKPLNSADPVYGFPCVWIDISESWSFVNNGHVLADEAGILLTHLAKVVTDFRHKMLLQSETQRILSAHANQELVAQLSSTDFQFHTLHKVLVALLEDGFHLRYIGDILFAVYDAVRLPATSMEGIVSHARRSLSPSHIGQYRNEAGNVNAISVSLTTSRELEEIFCDCGSDVFYLVGREKLTGICEKICEIMNEHITSTGGCVVITKAILRPHITAAFRTRRIPLFVASYEEISMRTDVRLIGTV